MSDNNGSASMKCKNCGLPIERICYHGHAWRHVGTSLFICFKDRRPMRGEKVYYEAEPQIEQIGKGRG